MAEVKPNHTWAVIIFILIAIIIVSTIIGLSRYQPVHAIEISLPPEQEFKGNIEISGAIVNPGFYPFAENDSLDSVLQMAGGFTSNANTNTLELIVLDNTAQNQPQKININRAEAWLLEALPGIGATRAKAIIIYREQNGPFRYTSELMKVADIGQTIYDNIKDLITVTD
jgi:competence protein ComEA